MKKLVLAALLAFVLLLASCRDGTVTFDPSDLTDMTIDKTGDQSATVLTIEELSRKLGIQFANGNFTEMYQNMSEKLRQNSDVATLKKQWIDYLSPAGYFVGFYGTETIPIDDYTAVKVFLIYENDDAVMSLKFNSDNKIDGLWLNTFTIPTPQRSVDFEETSVDILYDILPIDAILTRPLGVDRPPVVLLVSDLGKYDHNGTRGEAENTIMRDIAHGLAKQGVASLRMNKRFYQYPELYTKNSTLSEDTLFDVSAAIDYLSSCPYVDNDRIYMLGHGFSGSLGPKIALDNPEIKGLISLGGSSRHLADVYLVQSRLLALNNPSLSDNQRAINYENQVQRVAQIKSLSENGSEAYYSRYPAFWREVNLIDNSLIINYLDIPILVMHAQNDIEYTMSEYEAWQSLLEHDAKASFKLYQGLNHMFMPSNGKFNVSEYDPPAEVNGQVIEDIAAWVKDN